jgi:trafficking protein particle complex subunit 11
MEAYPEHYVAHNLPLILLSGIGHGEPGASESPERSRNLLQEGGFRIRTDVPPLTDPASENLLQIFLGFDSPIHGFNTKDVSTRDKPGAFKIKRVGRVG